MGEEYCCVECGLESELNGYCSECMQTICDACAVDGMCTQCSEDYEDDDHD